MNNSATCISVDDIIENDLTRYLAVKVLFSLLYGALMLGGFVGNGGVLFAVTRNKLLRSARNVFLLNLIVSDILLCLTAIPVTLWYSLAKDWQFGSFMCHLVPLSTSCSVFVTSWSLTAIALDRYIHIIDPTRASVTIRQASLVTLFLWLVCSLINVPHVMSYRQVDGSYYVKGNETPFCETFCEEVNWKGDSRQYYGSAVLLLQYIVPLTIITYCYTRILAKVSKDMIIQNAQFCESLTTSQRLEAMQRKRRVNYILIAMVVTFIGCWFPLTAVNMAKDFDVETDFMRRQQFLVALMSHSLAMSTVIWNPLLFFWLTRKRKKPILSRIIASSDAINTFVSRISSFRQGSTFRAHSPPSNKAARRQVTNDMNGMKSQPLLAADGDTSNNVGERTFSRTAL